MYRMHQKNIVDPGKRFRCNYFLFLILRWPKVVVSMIHTLMNLSNYITHHDIDPDRKQNTNGSRSIHEEDAKHTRHKTLRISTPTERESARVRKARSTLVLGGGLRGPSDALSYWSTIWDLVVLPPFGCRCSESTRRTGPRGLGLPTNRKERGLQVQRVRRIVHATKRALFKLKLSVLC